MSLWDYRGQLLLSVVGGAAVGPVVLLLAGAGTATSLLIGAPGGAYCGLLVTSHTLAISGRVRPSRRWNWQTQAYERRLAGFDLLILGLILLPLIMVACVILLKALLRA